ncbi:MAG TPA: LysM peptidoglycan-binding domain-containing protein [Cyclobacteriaceae bacterium]|nr:LysM peptidoglycan-binding domain-containing protein [Cyclobacteriaceae bacterium]HPW61484.1 LysM peptidoglycan-binding domain-containing protein [Cyclobacteriaceae bacterium]HRG78354.1 LysM peptidoglycan-binding domain-containing protein [Cyclobacteriaceae bacterium]
MRFCVVVFFVFASNLALAQDPLPDTLSLPEPTGEPLASDSTVATLLILPSDLEYIPGDDTPELIEDRLNCLEKQIPLTYNNTVHGFIDFFTVRNREYTRMVQRRQDLFFPLFEKYLAQYNLPDELKYLSIIESGLNPRAVSRARAVGLWQFMSGTGKYFGLQTDWYVDDRMDPDKSTDAACRYLSQLYRIFGNWELALAAYNSGPGTVRKAVRRSGYKKSFWEVYPHLPRETRAYVPQFIAIIYAMNYAEQHNLVETAREQIPLYDTLAVKQFLHFETLANLTGTCLEDLQKLNPSVLRNALPENGRKKIIKIPLHSKIILDSNRVAILDSASRVGRKEIELSAKNSTGNTYGREMTTYKVVSGDVLGSIAIRHRVSVQDLRTWNNLNGNTIRVGQRLVVWMAPGSSTAKNTVSAEAILLSPDTKTYIVQPGDTLWDISKKVPGLTVEKIKSLNNLKSNNLQPGQKLIVG